MFIECISNYFTNCVWVQLHDGVFEKYTASLIYFKRAMSNIENRKKIYQHITTVFNAEAKKNFSTTEFINSAVIEFFNQYIIEEKYIFDVFDKIIISTANQFIEYIHIYMADFVVKKDVDPHLSMSKMQFVRFISIEINKFSSLLIDKSVKFTDTQFKKLYAINNHLKTELLDHKKPKCDKETQT
jgi:hypothetical protein